MCSLPVGIRTNLVQSWTAFLLQLVTVVRDSHRYISVHARVPEDDLVAPNGTIQQLNKATLVPSLSTWMVTATNFIIRSSDNLDLRSTISHEWVLTLNPLNAKLNPICYLLALLGTHHFVHVSRIRVKSLTLRLLMSYIYIYIYIYGAPILDASRSHTTTHHSR